MQVKTKLPKVQNVSLPTAALCASEIPPTDRDTKQKNRLQPSDFKSTETMLPSSSQTNDIEETEENVVIASTVSELLERETSEIHIESQQNENLFFVTEVI